MRLYSYSDAECKLDKLETRIGTQSIQSAYIPTSKVSVSTSSTIIGDRSFSNILTYKFTPTTQMSPSGAGKIELGIPTLWEVNGLQQLMYNPEIKNKCYSSCMEITESVLQVDFINIYYKDMPFSCRKNAEIIIECPSFINPVHQGEWFGFFVNTYDNEGPGFRAIDTTDRTSIFLDATNYTPHTIPASSFLFSPADTMVQTLTDWDFRIEIGLPMMRECYIFMYMPSDFTFDFVSVEVSGIFTPRSRKT